MTSTKSIWLPKSETKVTVQDGKVTVWSEMVMEEKPIAKPTGFTSNTDSTTHPLFKPGTPH